MATHDRLVDTRAQVEHLSPLPDLSQTLRQAEQALQRLRLEKEHLGIYFGEVLAQLWSVQVEALKAEVEKLQEKLENNQYQLFSSCSFVSSSKGMSR